MKALLKLFALIATLTIFGCGSIEPLPDGWLELTINEGSNRAKPYRFTWKPRSYLSYEWRFDQSAAYELGDIDQCDWNKLTGLSLHKFGNHKNSVLVAWRYDREGFLWIAPYYHENENVFWADASCTDGFTPTAIDPDLQAIRVDIGDVIETHINLNIQGDWTALTIINTETGATSYWENEWEIDFTHTREIFPWFGGNEKAPHDITIYRRLIADQ